MRKVYTDPALKNNKKWTIYTTQTLYKQFKTTDVTTEYGLMRMANEALNVYIELFPEIKQLQNEAIEKEMELHEYIRYIVMQRSKILDETP